MLCQVPIVTSLEMPIKLFIYKLKSFIKKLDLVKFVQSLLIPSQIYGFMYWLDFHKTYPNKILDLDIAIIIS